MLNIYLINAILLSVTTIIYSADRDNIKIRKKNGIKEVHRDFFIFFFFAILLWLEYSFRGEFTTDDHHYKIWFERFKDESLKSVLSYDGVEKGFALINYSIGKITKNYQIFLMISGAFAIGCIMYSVWNLTDSKWPPFLVFIGTGLFYGGFNLTAQFLAASVFSLAILCILKGNLRNYLFLVIAAASIQKSAIIMLPLYFLLRCQGSKRNRGVVIGFLSVISIGLMFNIGDIAKRLSVILYEDHYIYSTHGGNSVSYIVKCVSLVAIIIYFTRLFDLEQIKDRMAYIGSILYGIVILWSVNFSMIQRFAYFLIIFPMMALSIIFCRTTNKKEFSLFFSLYFFIMQIGWFGQPYILYK